MSIQSPKTALLLAGLACMLGSPLWAQNDLDSLTGAASASAAHLPKPSADRVPIDIPEEARDHSQAREQRVEPEQLQSRGAAPPVQPKAAQPPAALRMRSRVDHEVEPPDAAPARNWHLRLSADSLPLWIGDPSLDPLTLTDVMPLGDLGVEIEWGFIQNIPVILQLHYATGLLGSHLLGDIQTRTWLHSAQLGVQGGYRFFDFATPYIRTGLSWSWTEVSLQDSATKINSWAMSPGFFALLGVEIMLSRRWIRERFDSAIVTAGLRAEAGYINLGWFDHRAHESQEKGKPAVYTAGLGALNFQGIATRFGFFLSY